MKIASDYTLRGKNFDEQKYHLKASCLYEFFDRTRKTAA